MPSEPISWLICCPSREPINDTNRVRRARCRVARVLSAGARLHAEVTFERLLNAAAEPQNWLTYSGSYASQRYSGLREIKPSNVAQLELKWVFQAQSLESFETTPLVVDGIMYLTEAPNTAIALDAGTGRVFWRYQHNPVARGAAVLRPSEPRTGHSRQYAVHGHDRLEARRHRRD